MTTRKKKAAKKSAKKTARRRANPPLLVWANPPRDLRAKVVKEAGSLEKIYYKHYDGKHYHHSFEPSDRVVFVTIEGQHCILLVSATGRDIWNDFK